LLASLGEWPELQFETARVTSIIASKRGASVSTCAQAEPMKLRPMIADMIRSVFQSRSAVRYRLGSTEDDHACLLAVLIVLTTASDKAADITSRNDIRP
jgi:hypothetical protein